MYADFAEKSAQEIGGYLTRVNEKGVLGIWECRPTCDADLPFETNILMALEGEAAPKQEK